MLWTTTPQNGLVYISPDGSEFLGAYMDSLGGMGWLSSVYPDDRNAARLVYEEGTARQAEYTMTFRHRRHDGAYVWVVAGATPSFARPGRRFLGYLGSTTLLAQDRAPCEFSARMGPPVAPMPLSTVAHCALDVVSDHLAMARSIAAAIPDFGVVQSLDQTMLDVARRFTEIEGAAGLIH